MNSKTVVHEFDLLLLPFTAADACRNAGLDPAHANVVGHAEVKYYGGNLPLPIGRAVVGLAAECDLKGKSVLVTNRYGPAVQDLVRHYGVEFRFLVIPAHKGEYFLVKFFEQVLQNAP